MDESIVLDIETSGLDERRDRVIKVTAEKFAGGQKIEVFSSFVACPEPLAPEVSALTGISNEDLFGAPTLDMVMANLLTFCGDIPVYAHNAPFAERFLSGYRLIVRALGHTSK